MNYCYRVLIVTVVVLPFFNGRSAGGSGDACSPLFDNRQLIGALILGDRS